MKEWRTHPSPPKKYTKKYTFLKFCFARKDLSLSTWFSKKKKYLVNQIISSKMISDSAALPKDSTDTCAPVTCSSSKINEFLTKPGSKCQIAKRLWSSTKVWHGFGKFVYYFLKLNIHNFSKIIIIKKSQNMRNEGFFLQFLLGDSRIRIGEARRDPVPQKWFYFFLKLKTNKKNCTKLWTERFSLRWRATAGPEKWEAPGMFSSSVSVSFRYNHSCPESLFHSHICPLKTVQVLNKICTEPKRLHKRNDDR